jgi:hypothetical protein
VAVPRESERHNVCHGSAAAVRDWGDAGANVILAGHIHLPFVIPLHEVMGPMPGHFWAVNAGTAVSSRVRYDAGNSVNVLRTSKDEPRVALLEHWGFSSVKSAFEGTAEVRLGRAAPHGCPVGMGEKSEKTPKHVTVSFVRIAQTCWPLVETSRNVPEGSVSGMPNGGEPQQASAPSVLTPQP